MSDDTVQYIKKGIKDELMSMHDVVYQAEDCISLLQNGFIYNTTLFLKDCRAKAMAMKKECARLGEKVIEGFNENPDVKPYLSIPGHLSSIGENTGKLSELIEQKIRENILFSDKAVRETIFLLQRLVEILRTTSDIILARNTFLSMYIQESQVGVGKMAGEYATLHEERLVKGVCLPAASALYINMLENIKSIAWHSKEIAVKLAGL